jgi:Na+-driven multidrug efflux pump
LTRENFRENAPQLRRIVAIGWPVSLQELLVAISFLIIVALINDISLVASAAIGIAEKMFLFLAIIPMSFISSLSAFVAQNVGARQERRAIKAVGIATLFSALFGFAITAVVYFAGDKLAMVFEDDPSVIAATAEYLRGAAFEYMMFPTTFCLLGYFNGTGKTGFMMLEGVFSAFLVRVPLSYYFSRLPDTNLFTIAMAVPIASFASLAACVVYFVYLRKKRLRLIPGE